ncbi:MAG: 50S ribosome-binding GTPase [Pirellulales bacterium]|nr:50S ribosome-binding GTPase [Pirellulales bacterium]
MIDRSANLASVTTPAGRGAVAVIAAAGPAAERAARRHFESASGKPLEAIPVDRIAFGCWTSDGHREEVLLVRDGDSLEIHCHGGAAAAERILEALQRAGCQVLPWTAWIARQHEDEVAAEADVALAEATTLRCAAILLDQRAGALQRAFDAIEQALARGDLALARGMLSPLFARAPLGLHLARPWQVAIAGRPNVGKSSLINALLGYQRAIVFDEPGTTRDVLTAETAIDGWPVRLIDAAGIRETSDPLESQGVALARQQLQAADLALWIDDATAPPEPAGLELPPELDRLPREKVLRVVNKIDLAPGTAASGEAFVSALTGQGLDRLLALLGRRLAPDPPKPGEAVPFTERHLRRLEAMRLSISARGDLRPT